MIPRQNRAAASAGGSPRSSTGNSSGRGSSPTSTCDCLRSTASAIRSPNVAPPTFTVSTSDIAMSVLPSPDAERGPCDPRSKLALRRCYIIELLTALFSLLPAENFGTFDAGMCTRSLGLRGFTP